jgi:prevent-host-death family protein
MCWTEGMAPTEASKSRHDPGIMTMVILAAQDSMSEIISKSKFKPAALEYFRRVQETGEELIISDRGKPVVKIVPFKVERSTSRKAVRPLLGSLLRYDEPFEPVGLEDWEALK